LLYDKFGPEGFRGRTVLPQAICAAAHDRQSPESPLCPLRRHVRSGGSADSHPCLHSPVVAGDKGDFRRPPEPRVPTAKSEDQPPIHDKRAPEESESHLPRPNRKSYLSIEESGDTWSCTYSKIPFPAAEDSPARGETELRHGNSLPRN